MKPRDFLQKSLGGNLCLTLTISFSEVTNCLFYHPIHFSVADDLLPSFAVPVEGQLPSLGIVQHQLYFSWYKQILPITLWVMGKLYGTAQAGLMQPFARNKAVLEGVIQNQNQTIGFRGKIPSEGTRFYRLSVITLDRREFSRPRGVCEKTRSDSDGQGRNLKR
jgi:hypothetical protein